MPKLRLHQLENVVQAAHLSSKVKLWELEIKNLQRNSRAKSFLERQIPNNING